MIDQIPTIASLTASNPEGLIKGKKTVFSGLGRIVSAHCRHAPSCLKVLTEPFLRAPIGLKGFQRIVFRHRSRSA